MRKNFIENDSQFGKTPLRRFAGLALDWKIKKKSFCRGGNLLGRLGYPQVSGRPWQNERNYSLGMSLMRLIKGLQSHTRLITNKLDTVEPLITDTAGEFKFCPL
jgi:hypothetical protein